MAKLWVGRGVGYRGAAPLMPPRWLGVFPLVWWALGGWPTGSPVGYGLTGSVAGGPEPRVQGTAAGPGGGAVNHPGFGRDSLLGSGDQTD